MIGALVKQFLQRRRPAVAAPPKVDLEAIDLQTLLKRPAIDLDTPELQRFLAGKRVMVTGAGGSIGSEICRQICKFCPSRLILVEQAENALFEIDRELAGRWMGMSIAPHIADITDAVRIDQIFAAEKPQVIFHCAAHKHVPMMELNPGEAVKNNVFGTKILVDASIAHAVAAFAIVRFGHYSLSSEGLSIQVVMGTGVLTTGLLLAAALGIVAGLVPAWQVSRREITESFRAV